MDTNVDNIKKANITEQYVLNKAKENNILNLSDIKLCIYVNDKLTFFFKNSKTSK